MAGIYTDFWRIVKPTTSKSGYVAANPDDFKLYSNFSWYTKIMKGAGSRFAKYQQYKNMDGDVFVARALDTIAEEMTTVNIKTNLPFDIEYQNEVDKEVPERITMTVRAALRHWCDLHELDNRLFDIARIMIKYGDCFFRKRSDLKEWEYIEPNDVIGVSIDKQTNKVQFYQLKKGGSGSDKSGSVGEVEIVPASGMIHFTLSSGFDENAPFGDSVLFPTIKAYRHLTLLEDAVIIYRIVRAPERRVFMIDVGNMPQQRAKAYLESIKTEIRQKRVPNESGGQEKVDGVYNPMSMTEDYFFMQTPDGRGSKVETLAGGENLGEIADLKFFQSKFLQGLRIPSSYMRGSDDSGAQVQDGKVGVAYIEELRFANYVKRLQQGLNKIFDAQFKAYMKTAGINIDPDIFKLKLVDPQNFQIYKQAEVDEKLISNFNNLKEVKYLSPRHLMRTILNWSDDDIQANEIQRKQELGIPDGGFGGLTELRMLYDPAWLEKPPEIKVHSSFNDFTADTRGAAPEEAEEPATGADKEGEESEEDADAEGAESEEPAEDEPPELDDLEKEAK
jgi:hypothetical protein